jgi:hypothetical protein
VIAMPYWSIFCLYCHGYIADALLECLPAGKRAHPAFRLLFATQAGACLACPYCNRPFGFDNGEPCVPQAGWPVFRYGRAELEVKKEEDGGAAQTTLTEWALQYRFALPGTQDPLACYTYAEQAPPDETVS